MSPVEREFQRLQRCIEHLHGLLVPPFPETEARLDGLRNDGDKAMEGICEVLGAEAGALFVVSEDAPGRLRCVHTHGYKERYRGTVYHLEEPKLTAHVFTQRKTVAGRAEDPELTKLNCSNSCSDQLTHGKFRSLLAAPIHHENQPLGVLRLENKQGDEKTAKFTLEDRLLAESLARILASSLRQRAYSRLWLQGERELATARSEREYLDRVAELLCKALPASSCSIFLRCEDEKGNPSLYFGGGQGYRADYREYTYVLPGPGNTDAVQIARNSRVPSVTGWIYQGRRVIRKTEAELIALQQGTNAFEYLRACSHWLNQEFKNLLGVALVEHENHFGDEKAECYGVLKVENHQPKDTTFGAHDEAVCIAFVTRQIFPTLRRFRNRQQRTKTGGPFGASGVDYLQQTLGPAPKKPKRYQPGSTVPDSKPWTEALRNIFKAVKEGRATHSDGIAYLGMPKATYHVYRKDPRFE